ncbi:MAG: sensor histidine kinase [Planctomycetes bacterium]|jgi:cytochrome bd-type quinol oxidase subunit 2|nr:sensor histidine kinase [Planctomycetota bacterium]
MILTIWVPRDDPVGVVSVLSAVAVLATLAMLGSTRALADRRATIAAAFTVAMVPLSILVLMLPEYPRCRDHYVDRLEVAISHFILLAGAFGCAMACTRRPSRLLKIVGLVVLLTAGSILVAEAMGIQLVFRMPEPIPTPLLSTDLVVLVSSLSGWSLRNVLAPGSQPGIRLSA